MSDPDPIRSTADLLRAVGEILVHGEHAMGYMALSMGMPIPEPISAPRLAVRIIADWFDEHPDADAQIVALFDMWDTTL